jgi:hypothetical protein
MDCAQLWLFMSRAKRLVLDNLALQTELSVCAHACAAGLCVVIGHVCDTAAGSPSWLVVQSKWWAVAWLAVVIKFAQAALQSSQSMLCD